MNPITSLLLALALALAPTADTSGVASKARPACDHAGTCPPCGIVCEIICTLGGCEPVESCPMPCAPKSCRQVCGAGR